jgi:hypothetical protein
MEIQTTEAVVPEPFETEIARASWKGISHQLVIKFQHN